MRLLLFLPLLLGSCAPDPLAIPGPATTVTRKEAVATAYTYVSLAWMPKQRHVRHGADETGLLVHTPDKGLNGHGYSNGWWVPGKEAVGMPYQWGGFDTPREFLKSLNRGEVAGDIATPLKRELGDGGTSESACGIDCSGFVSRCWRLDRSVSTRELPEICSELETWEELRSGDILLNDKHVLLFVGWHSKSYVIACEAGPLPMWKVNRSAIPVSKLLREGYRPWRYQGMRD